MHQLMAVARGLAHRSGSTLTILLVALVATAAAAAGPAYYEAAKISILQDAVTGAALTGRGFEANLTGPVNGTLPSLTDAVRGELRTDLGPAASRLFAPPVTSIEGTGFYRPEGLGFVLAWRTGMCAHLRIRGTCPSAAQQVIVSEPMARLLGWHIGQRVAGAGWPSLRITGIYRPPVGGASYWAPRAETYFPLEAPASAQSQSGPALDAMFTAPATLKQAPPTQQGTAVIDASLNPQHLRAADVPRLRSAMSAFDNSANLTGQSIIVATAIPATLSRVSAGWRTVAVPVVLITATMLMLSWLLLFLSVTDAVEARGTEVALAKLRGHGRWGTLLFGLSEPAALLATAFPAGAAVGWASAAALDSVLLRPGTPTRMPALAWAAAAVATLGGFAAVTLAARRTLRRTVVEQFRRSGRSSTDRGWVVDAVLLTGSVAGLGELLFTGTVRSASHNVLSLLVPGLLGLAVAVVASRALPMACRAVYNRTGRHGGLARYLAVRHIARRPGGVRTTIVLATAFALAAFGVAAWSVGRQNYQLVAGAQVGAPAVLTVTAPDGKDLGALVARADPSGRQATVVDSYVGLSGPTAGNVTLAVDPQRFARIASWSPHFAAKPLAALAAQLHPPAPPPVILTGDAMRITVRVSSLTVAGEQVSADVTTGSSPVDLGSLPTHGTATLTGPLAGCPCVLRDLTLGLPGRAIQHGGLNKAVSGNLTITALQVHDHGRWRPAGQGVLTSRARWKEGNADHPPDVIAAGPGGLRWSFSGVPGRVAPTLSSVNMPSALPALIPAALTAGRTGLFTGVGLDGKPLTLRSVAAVAAVPGAPGFGVIVDRRYAELAAGNLTAVTQQVWLAAGALRPIETRLKAAEVRIDSVRTSAAVTTALERQGPALASVLFLADAAAAAVLAAGAAVLGLYLSARRRRYEYAALVATGLRRRVLRRAVLIELAVVLGFGSVVGILSGLAGAALVLRGVPEFMTVPAAPPLSYRPPAGPLAGLLGAAVALLIVVAVVSSITLIRGIRLEQLREAPQ
ncbi:MAG TPA: FtsX-like permease family protein [Streptosporangiaceae bacterium]